MRYTYRLNEQVIFQSFATPFISAILGPRRVGKSTLVEHYVQQHTHDRWVLLNMDYREQRRKAEAGHLQRMIEESALQAIGSGSLIRVVIDEVQKAPAAFEQIKILYDKYKDQNKIKFILTGSAVLQLHQLSAETLAGRIELHNLREFSLKEATILQNSEVEISQTFPQASFFNALIGNYAPQQCEEIVRNLQPFRILLERSLHEQIVWGGFPEVLSIKEADAKRRYLASYLQTYLEKDIRDIDTIADLTLYQHMMQVIAEQTGSLRDDKKILEALSCSRNTFKKYRGYLLATLLLSEIYPYVNSSLKRLIKSPKAYLQDNGLISYLTGIDDFDILEKTGLIGHRLENWFLKELQIWLDRDSHHSEIYFWRSSNNKEVDFIVQRKPNIFPFEVTYSQKIDSRKLKNLEEFMLNNKESPFGVYIYSGDFKYDDKKRIYFLPIWAVG